MPTFEPGESGETGPNKIIYIGESGAGKTGSLAALAAAGYNVRILDLDKGVQILRDYMQNKEKSIYLRERPGLWDATLAAGTPKRLSFVSLDETMVLAGPPGKQRYTPKGDLWGKAMAQMDDWIDGPNKYGNIGTWTEKDVLVLDGLSRLAQAALNQQLAMSGNIAKFGTTPIDVRPDMYSAQTAIERLLLTLYSSAVKCHVVMICHIAFTNVEGEAILRGFPQTIGKALAPKIGQYFNHVIMAKEVNHKRMVVTDSSGLVKLKTSAPLRVKPEYPLETGLAEYFRDVAGK